MKMILKKIFLTVLFTFFACVSLVNAQELIQTDIQPQTSKQKDVEVSEASSIETLFGEDIGNLSDVKNKQSKLKQVGYDFFSNANVQGFGKYDGAYKLNIGEKVDIYLWGDSVDMLSISGSSMLSPLTKSQVDTKGNIFVPGVGIVKAEGRSISSVESEIQSLASQKFTNAKVRITVADSTEFAIFVYGYVNKPGKVTVSNNSSVIEALAAAGGVNKNGTLRNISYKSGGKTQKVDLYGMIFQGKDSNVRLQPNDTIYVNNLGPVVAIKNGVKIPGIYELGPNDTISNVIGYAGGFLPSTNKNVINVKTYKNGQRASTDIVSDAFGRTKLANGDIIQFRSVFGVAENVVSLEGNVKHPAIFEYKKGMKLSDILKSKNELQDETFIYQAVIKRVSGEGKQITSIPVSLENFFNGGNNPELQPKDVIMVYKSTNNNFIEVYGCINKPKQVPYTENLTLSDVMTDLQFMVSSTPDSNIHNVSSINKSANTQSVAMTTSNNNVVIPAYDVAVEITNADSLKTFYLYDILVQSDGVKGVVINPEDKIFFRPLRENEIVKTVKMSGFVKKPGVYSFVEGKKLSDMIETAGGLTKDANLRGIVYRRSTLVQKEKEANAVKVQKDLQLIEGQMANDMNATKDDVEARKATMEDISKESKKFTNNLSGRISLNIKTNDITKIDKADNLDIQDGDEIYIPKFSNHVMVVGEVYNESSFIYKKDADAAYYIKLVGGFTPNARKTKIYKIGANGRAYRLGLLAHNKVEPGDTIIVPRKIRGNDWIQPLASTIQSIASILVSVFVVTKI